MNLFLAPTGRKLIAQGVAHSETLGGEISYIYTHSAVSAVGGNGGVGNVEGQHAPVLHSAKAPLNPGLNDERPFGVINEQHILMRLPYIIIRENLIVEKFRYEILS